MTMNNILMTSNVCFIGVGQGGGNIANQFHKMGYTTFYINTSNTDLDTINVPKQYKYCPPAASGTSKNRALAQGYFAKYEELIVQLIKARLSSFRHIFVCASTGGGTGSGMIPVMLRSFIDNIPGITFGAILGLPSLKESYKVKHNSQECIAEIQEIDGLGATYIIDNQAALVDGIRLPISSVDDTFANCLNDFLSISQASREGVIDEKEILTMLSISGYSLFANLNKTGKSLKDKVSINNVMPPTVKGCRQIAYHLNDDRDLIQDDVESVFGKPPLDLMSYSKELPPFAAIFGLEFPIGKMNQIVDSSISDQATIEDDNIEQVVNPIVIEVEEFVDPVLKIRKDRDTGARFKKKLSNMIDLNSL